jgi:tetratricopeptide (TPR) repeat protein
MRKLLTTTLIALTLLTAACGSVKNTKDTKFTETNRDAVIDKVLKSAGLTDEERMLAILAIGRYQMTGRSLAGKSVGELIDELKDEIDKSGKTGRFDSKSAEVHNNVGTALDGLGRHEEAVAEYDKAIRINPKIAIPQNNKGNSLSALGRHEEAVACFDNAISLDPKFAQPYKGKGNSLYSLGRYDEAVAEYDKAIELNPNYASAYHNKGVALHALGRSEEAKAAFTKAHELDPSFEVPEEYK